ncbi:PREDICTED: trypsin-1-like [Rhagoletis zephyria]|uniref:trypsin-1-like n=1 Tax=Rhagoletis zephyria TaxID=28612 RepID=UPI00081175B1|nr:PREDICTED: trypsin-1-like [Rhagoletis zephyria]
MCQLKSVIWTVLLLHLSAGRVESGYIYEPPKSQNPALPQENEGSGNGYQYPPPLASQPALPEPTVSGYYYPHPPQRIPVLPAENIDYRPVSNDSSATLPPGVLGDFIGDLPTNQPPGNNESFATPPQGVMGDFITDIINAQKEQILSSLLGGNGDDHDSPDDDAKKFRFNKCSSCSCGVPNVKRIVGGQSVDYNKHPWAGQIRKKGFVFCGGTLINNLYLLTAGHCCDGLSMNQITVHLLELSRSARDKGITRRVVGVKVHNKYNRNTLENDICLLKLDKRVPLDHPLRPACMPNPSQSFHRKEATVVGWGTTSQDGRVASVLQEVNVPVITNEECRKTSYKNMIKSTMLCAGYVGKGGKDACQGDSGGPLVVRDRVYSLAGIVSFGFGCARPDSPGVYTRVTKYLGWIATNTKDACYCSQ